MIGLVIVSHSARLAEGVLELARDMAGPDVPMAAAGGLALPGQPLGTDARLVQDAITSVYSPDGVIVLMDLGSAILSAEMALEQFPAEQRLSIRLCEAPLVEGALAAAVQSRLGSPLEKVIEEARGALAAKATQLSLPSPVPSIVLSSTVAEVPSANANGTHQISIVVRNPFGLHARPAAQLAQVAGRFPQTTIWVENVTMKRGPVSARSITGLASLGVRSGHELIVRSDGDDAEPALESIRALADGNFGEMLTDSNSNLHMDQPRATVDSDTARAGDFVAGTEHRFVGVPASPGIALGVVRRLSRSAPDITQRQVTNTQAEWDNLLVALQVTREQIESARSTVLVHAGAGTAAIFDTHLLFLDDDAFLKPTRQRIFHDHWNAEAAWQEATRAVVAQYETLDDEYLRQRADDAAAVGQQVLLNLLGEKGGPALLDNLDSPCILLADDLTPAETAQLKPEFVLAVCTAAGGPTSHSAILARTFGIPAVVGVGKGLLKLHDGTPLIVDGSSGLIIAEPETAVRADYVRRAQEYHRQQMAARAVGGIPSVTRDGRRVDVAANIGSADDAHRAMEAGAEGVGLFRTEFLFLDRQSAPSEDEQYEIYQAVAQRLQGKPLILRTLDIGGDKPIPYLGFDYEANPFLGVRGIRLCLAEPALFKTQLRAVLRAAANWPLKMMFPMITTLTDWREAMVLVAESRADLLSQGVAVPDRIDAGIMVEVPSVAIQAARFAPEVDFFSIGTNDLTQYTLAVERGNARVAAFSDALSPAVLQLIDQVVKAAHAQGKWVGVCGELAGDPLAVPLLVGLGVDELSMNAPAIAIAKQIIRAVDYSAERANASDLLQLDTAATVRDHLRQRVRS